jgi:hypothetical protein
VERGWCGHGIHCASPLSLVRVCVYVSRRDVQRGRAKRDVMETTKHDGQDETCTFYSFLDHMYDVLLLSCPAVTIWCCAATYCSYGAVAPLQSGVLDEKGGLRVYSSFWVNSESTIHGMRHVLWEGGICTEQTMASKTRYRSKSLHIPLQ